MLTMMMKMIHEYDVAFLSPFPINNNKNKK